MSARAAPLRRFALWLACSLLALGLLGLGRCGIRCGPPPSALATFNIRDFPERPEQIPAAFAVMRELDVPVIAVQEIRDVDMFQAGAREYLGSDWASVFNHEPVDGQTSQSRPRRVGLAWDGGRYRLDFYLTHDDVRVRPTQRPALEVRLTPRAEGPALRVFVVHLKAGGKLKDHQLRREQLMRLRRVVDAAMRSNDEVIVIGDFNASGPADRYALQQFADDTATVWASAKLPCTAYWRPEGRCEGSALDHAFTRAAPRTIAAKGACERAGCTPGERCPIDYARVSDHCPVALQLNE